MPHGKNHWRAVWTVVGLCAVATTLTGCHQFPFNRAEQLSQKLGLPNAKPAGVAELEPSEVQEHELLPPSDSTTKVAANQPDQQTVDELPETSASKPKRDPAVKRAEAITPVKESSSRENEDAAATEEPNDGPKRLKRLPKKIELALSEAKDEGAAPAAEPKEEESPSEAPKRADDDGAGSNPMPSETVAGPEELPAPRSQPRKRNTEPEATEPEQDSKPGTADAEPEANEPDQKPKSAGPHAEPEANEPQQEAKPVAPDAEPEANESEARTQPATAEKESGAKELPKPSEAPESDPSTADSTGLPAPAEATDRDATPQRKTSPDSATEPEKADSGESDQAGEPAKPSEQASEPEPQNEGGGQESRSSDAESAEKDDSPSSSGDAEPRTNSPDAPELAEAPKPSERSDRVEATAPPEAPVSWDDELGRLRRLARAHLKDGADPQTDDWALRAQLVDQLAKVPPEGRIDPHWQTIVKLLRASEGPDTPQRSSQLRDAVQTLEERVPLEIVELQLCRKVNGFGSTSPLEQNATRAGRPLIVYCELNGLRYEKSGDLFHSRLASHVELVDRKSGAVVWKKNLGTAEDVCRRRRRDYYVNYRFTLPERLQAGSYELQLSQTDEIAATSVRATTDLEILP